MKLIFVRHGETQEGKKGIILGSQDEHLTRQGKKEMRRIAQELKAKKITPDIIISSPLKRALDSATIISQTIKIKMVTDSLTRERAAGIAEGKSDNDIDWEAYEKKPLLERKHKGGEQFTDVYKRAEKFIQRLQKRYGTETILVISHSVFILMCIALLKKKSIAYILKHKPKERIIIITIKK